MKTISWSFSLNHSSLVSLGRIRPNDRFCFYTTDAPNAQHQSILSMSENKLLDVSRVIKSSVKGISCWSYLKRKGTHPEGSCHVAPLWYLCAASAPSIPLRDQLMYFKGWGAIFSDMISSILESNFRDSPVSATQTCQTLGGVGGAGSAHRGESHCEYGSTYDSYVTPTWDKRELMSDERRRSMRHTERVKSTCAVLRDSLCKSLLWLDAARMCVGCMWEAETEGCTDGAKTEEWSN